MLNDLIKGLRRSTKSDDIPGTVEEYLEEICPICGNRMKKYRPCCGSPSGYTGCNCGYKVMYDGN